MVQMHEMMRSGGYESIAEAGLPEADLEDKDSKSLEVCAEFLKSGGCKAGVNCRFVHDNAFRKDGAQDAEADTGMNVDPEDFIRRALHLRAQQKNRRNDNRAPVIPFQSFF